MAEIGLCTVRTRRQGGGFSASVSVAGHTDPAGAAAAPELPALTSLRGIAALVVVLFHTSFLAFHYAGGDPPWIFRRGYLAVDLFFLLSGFILTHVYGRRLAEKKSWRIIGKFFWTRFSRIYPASLFTTAIFVLQYVTGRLPFPSGVSFKAQLIAALLLMQVPWLDEVVINGPSWSISAECYAYLLFPFVVPTIYRMKARTAATIGIMILIVIAIGGSQTQVFGWGALGRALPEFTVGALTYRCYSERLFWKFWEKDTVLIAVALMLIWASLADLPDGFVVILLLALLLASACNSGRMAVILNARPLRWLGEVSYSVYIFQMLPFMAVASLSGLLVAVGFGGFRFEVIAVSFAISSGILVHRCVDVPIRGALRRLPHRIIGFAAVGQEAKIRFTSLTSDGLPERDR
jgi:peptidoglycan/LPS O-acetylase OafA/YrhL